MRSRRIVMKADSANDMDPRLLKRPGRDFEALNVTTFRRRLREAANEFRLELDQAEVEAITVTRDELVHRAGSVTHKPLNELERVQSVLDRLLLGLLGCRGPYRSTSPTATSSPNIALINWASVRCRDDGALY